MATQGTQGARLEDLRRLSTALTENAGDLQAVGGAMTQLDAIVQQAQEAAASQAAFTASRLEATEELQRLLREGSRLATGLRQHVRFHYGISAAKLAEFGMQPFRGRNRKAIPVVPIEPEPETEPVNPDGTPVE